MVGIFKFLLKMYIMKIFFLIILFLGAGCKPAPNYTKSDNTMAQRKINNWLGKWAKITTSDCAKNYPQQIDFNEKGLFNAQKSNDIYTLWDVGTYEMGQDTVKISTANDAIIAYNYKMVGDMLTFLDANGCEFIYKKVQF